MNRYICTKCGRFCYSASVPATVRDNDCPFPGCGGSVIPAPENQKCRICGCTWDRACPGGCYWVEPDLCSRCATMEAAGHHNRLEVTITPHKPGDGGILAMPLVANIPNPSRDDWTETTCPVCGTACWQSNAHRETLKHEPELKTACTMCALKAGLSQK